MSLICLIPLHLHRARQVWLLLSLYKWGRKVDPGLLSIKSRLESRCLWVWRPVQAARSTARAASYLSDLRSCQKLESQPLPQLAVWKILQALQKGPCKRFVCLLAHKWVIWSPFTIQVWFCFLIWNNTIQLAKPAGRTLLLLFLNIMWKSCWPRALQQAQIVQGLFTEEARWPSGIEERGPLLHGLPGEASALSSPSSWYNHCIRGRRDIVPWPVFELCDADCKGKHLSSHSRPFWKHSLSPTGTSSALYIQGFVCAVSNVAVLPQCLLGKWEMRFFFARTPSI